MSRRLLASYLAVALIVLLALEIPLAISLARNERSTLTTRIERQAVVIASLAEDALKDGAPTTRIAAITADYERTTGGRVVIVSRTGQSVIDTSDPNAAPREFESRPEIGRALDGNVATGTRRSDDLNQEILYVAVPVASAGVVHGAVRITYPTAEVNARVRRSLWVLIAIALVTLAVVALVGWRFARATAVPLARVERAAVAAGRGDLSVRAPVGGPPEVSSLANSFNTMVARLAELVRSQEGFVADASHQLRTPLAALRLRLENLEPNIDRPGRDNLEGAISELDRLGRLVDGLLVLARSDRDATTPSAIDVAELARDRVELWSALGEEHGVVVTSECPVPAWASSTPGRLEQVLDNLIENALAVSPPDSTVTVSIVSTSSAHEIHVSDEGPGMSPEDRVRAFDRFWRSPKTTTEGTGLGLAIVKRLVESDGGSIDLRAAPGGGLDVVVTLSRAADSSARRSP